MKTMPQQSRLVNIFLIFCLFASLAFSQAPQHTRLLYENSLLSEGEDDFAVATNFSGTFLANGWQANRDSKLTLQLKDRLPATGSIEFSLTNYDPVIQTTNGKQTLFCMTSRSHSQLSLFYEDSLSAFTFLRTGTNYVNGTSCGLEFDTAYEGAKSRDKDREVLMDKKWQRDKIYQFKFVWDHDYIWLYFNGEEIKKQLMKGPIERIQHISIGGDDIYNTLAGPIFSDVKIYTAETDVIFDDKSFSKNVSGLSDLKGGHGLAVADVNNDGLDDIYVANYQDGKNLRDILYIQQSDFTFIDETSARGISNNGGSFSALFFDTDNDGDVDLFSSRRGAANQLYINDGSGHFSDESASRGLASQDESTSAAVAFDADNDGDIDVLAVNQNTSHELYINDGSGLFSRQDRGLRVGNASGDNMPSVTTSDVDNDGDTDIYISWPHTANELYVNNGDGMFSEQAETFGIAFPSGSQGAVFVDYDNDGDADLLLASKVNSYSSDSLYLHIYNNDGTGRFAENAGISKLAMNGYDVQLFDANNDGYLDIYCLQNNQFDRYYENRTWNFLRTSTGRLYLGNGGTFSYAGDCGLDIVGADSRSLVANDFDNDGDIDVYLTTAQYENVYLENNSEFDNNWIDITVIGPGGDRGGIGSKISLYKAGHLGDEVYALAHRQVVSTSGYLSANNLRQHFGLGDVTGCDILIERVDGSVQTRTSVPANAAHIFSPDVYHLNYVSGNEQNGYTNERLPHPLVVQVMNQENQPVENVPILFQVVSGDGAIDGQSTVLTDASGTTQVFLQAGPTAGNLIVHASLPNALNSPIEFVAHIETQIFLLVKTGGDEQSGTVGEILPENSVVQVLDGHGLAVADHAVDFKIVSGQGHIQGSSHYSTNTDAGGFASASWTLGTAIGVQHLVAITEDDSVLFSATALAGPVAVINKTNGDGQSLKPGSEFPEPFVVFAGDAFGNPVSDVELSFSVMSGGGHLRGDSAQSITTNQEGYAQTFWTPGPYLGPLNILQASVNSASSVENSPLQWDYPGLDVSGNYSTLTATSPIPADGVSASEIVVTLKDNNHESLGAGFTVHFSASGHNNEWQVPDSVTNAQGMIRAFLKSAVVEKKEITATVMGLNLTVGNGATVDFTPLEQQPAQLAKISGDDQTGTVGKPLSTPLVVRLLDADGNGVADYPVWFQVQLNGGVADTLDLSNVITDANGQASLSYVLGSHAGTTRIAALVDSVSGSPALFKITALPDVAAALTKVSGDSQHVDHDAELPKPLIVKIADRFGNGISGWPITFSALNGGDILSPQPIKTDSLGLATCKVKIADIGSIFNFSATSDSLGTVTFTAFSRQGQINNPPRIESYFPSDSILAATYGQQITFTLAAMDPDDDPLSYQWFLNQTSVSDTTFFTFTATENLTSPATITAFVYDFADTTIQQWIVSFDQTGVELYGLTAESVPGVGITLSWHMPHYADGLRFDIQKSEAELGHYKTIGAARSKESQQIKYEFVDKNIEGNTTYFYKIRITYADGQMSELGPVSAFAAAPREIALQPNYPNPFNPTTSIRFELPSTMHVSVTIFNANGQRVKSLVNGDMNAGNHAITWNADNDDGLIVPSGIYYCRLQADGHMMVRKMVLLK